MEAGREGLVSWRCKSTTGLWSLSATPKRENVG